jgi:hypothetical protein
VRFGVTIVVDEASDGSGPFADGELELVGWVFVQGYDARSGRWIRAEGADPYNQVGTLAPRRSALPMRAGERRQLSIDTVVEFPASEPLDARSFIMTARRKPASSGAGGSRQHDTTHVRDQADSPHYSILV